MEIKYTKEQRLAITSKGQNIIVSAGAGSGKTQVLTERVVYFIKNEGYQLDEFLILTFTNLAAAEMKNRIRKTLQNRNLEQAKDVDSADICTFDSYALSLVKKYHFLLGLSENVSIIDSNLIEVRKRTILNEIMENYYAIEDQDFLKMIDRFCFKDDSEIKKLILKVYSKAILANNTDEYLDNFVSKYYNNDLLEEIVDRTFQYLQEQMKCFETSINNLPNVELPKYQNQKLNEFYLEYFDKSINASNYDALISNFHDKLPFPKPRNVEATDYENFKKSYDSLKKIIESFPKTSQLVKDNILENKFIASKIIEIIKVLDYQIKVYKNNYQIYEFSDIAKLALKLIKDNEEIKNTIKNKLKMLMIDEYQDTSYLQEEFINLIGNNNIYMVGDVKQSIYRFRNARCDIFVDKYEQYKYNNKGLAIDLNKNFRSRKEVLDDINYIFKNIMTKELGGADYLNEHMIEFGNKAFVEFDPKTNHHLEYLVYCDDFKDSVAIEAHLIARDIINKVNTKYQVMDTVNKVNLLRDCKFSDFCILIDRGSAFDTYAKIFNDYQIPLFIEHDENIASTDLVLVLINLLKIINAIKNNEKINEYKQAFISLARSFLYNYSDEEIYKIVKNNNYKETEIIKSIKEILAESSVYPIVEQFKQVIFKLDIYNRCLYSGNVNKNTKYLDTFIELFESLAHLDYTLDDLISYLEDIDNYDLKINLSSTGSDIDSVKLMNIHKSKGLEFKIVYYPRLKPKFNLMELNEKIGISEKYGLILPPKNISEKDVIKLLNKLNEEKEDLSEHIRLFYVAVTRTKEKMIFVTPSNIAEKLKLDLFNEELKNFIEKYHFDNQSKEDKFNILVDSLYRGDILISLFTKLSDKEEFLYPSDFKYQKANFIIKDYPKDKLFEYYHYLEEYKNYLKEDTVQRLIILYGEVINNKIKKEEFKYLLSTTNYKLNKEINFISNDLNPQDFIMIGENSNIEDNNSELSIPPFIENVLDLYQQGIVDEAFLNKYLRCLGFNSYHEFKKYIDSNNYVDFYNKININEFEIKLLEEFPKVGDASLAYLLLNDRLKNEEYLDIISFFIHNHPDYDRLKEIIDYLGYDLSDALKEILDDYFLKHNGEALKKINMLESEELFIPNDKLFKYFQKDEKNSYFYLLEKYYDWFKNNVISIAELKKMAKYLNYDLDRDFEKMSVHEHLQFEINDMELIFVEEKNEEIETAVKNATNMYAFISNFISYRKFNSYTYLLEKKKEIVNFKKNQDVNQTLEIIPLNIKLTKENVRHASKKLDLKASQRNIDFGTNIHKTLEMIDFKNPNFDFIESNYEKKIIHNFLESLIMKNLSSAKIYKEYEFVDDLNNTTGIIDLMLIYDDHIDIVDYKTKNISDANYNEQLLIYKAFIKQKTNKVVNIYLYSLLTNELLKIE